ncbi:transposase [Cryobacterium sp. PAMC25264]|uniref:transposase n=1 Tax=Cryobacterium sp. PAMC25264 TaxID=2861288 RepID=UPI001C62D8E1|nr:transposase [Cryobacterium sp. PAMC25264]QYF72489.1 transposase [Cryobacterium sp. PAMC25264]
MAVSLTAIAQELYGLAPADFTAHRNARARDLRPTDAALATQVAALRKPSPAAWVMNLIARERAEKLEALLRLGEKMRQAQERLDRDELRRLGAERRDAVAGLAREAADLAQAAGYPPTASVLGEVEQALQAATSDPAAAAAAAAGLLVRALRAVGFEPVDLLDAVAVPGAAAVPSPKPASSSSTPPVQLHQVRLRKEARREAERLEGDAEAAAATLDALDRRAHRLDLRRQRLEAEVAALREQLREAESTRTAVDDDSQALVDARSAAQAQADTTSRRAHEARAAADALAAQD